jgi:general secretion pathway protein K
VRYPVHNKGVALITAVLVTAIIVIAAVGMAAEQQLELRRTSNIIEGDRAYLFALGVESWAAQILTQDRQNSQIDYLGQDWATVLPPITVEGAVIIGHLEDAQGRFNLNDLVKAGKASPLDVERFRRLLSLVGANPNLSDAVVDWIDPDSEVTYPNGAEDEEYMSQTIPYRAANRMMISASELLLIKGFTAQAYQALAPYVIALPARTSINVNTADKVVLMALIPDISEGDLETLLTTRQNGAFANVSAFAQQKVLAGRNVEMQGLSVASDYFLLDALSRYGHGQVHIFSLLARKDNETRVIWRAQGTY